MPRLKTFPGTAIPQRDQLQDVRRVVEALTQAPGATGILPKATGLSNRHAQYARHAAVTLGFLTDDGVVTPAGRKLTTEAPGGLSERSRFRIAIEQSPVLKKIAPDLLTRTAPTKTTLAKRILKHAPELGEVTALRRASALLAWRDQALDPQLPLLGKDRYAAEASFSVQYGRHLHRMNPWWQEGLPPPTPKTLRDIVPVVEHRLRQRLAPIVVVRGPRQVGKTTAQLQIIERLLRSGVEPKRIMRLQCDELPSVAETHEQLLSAVEWFEANVLQQSLNDAARAFGAVYLFFDEVQNVPSWTAELKHLVDVTANELRVFVTGSSALKIAKGKDSLAGRLQTLDIGTLTLREIASIRFGETLPGSTPTTTVDFAERDFWIEARESPNASTRAGTRAFAAFSKFGGYPMAHRTTEATWEDVAAQLKETVIDRVISHDLRISQLGRRPDSGLLTETFRLCCRYAGQAPTTRRLATEATQSLGIGVGPERILHYLKLFDMALLLRCIPATEMRLKGNRGPAKLSLVDHAIRAAWLHEVIPIEPVGLTNQVMTTLAGHIVESVVGAHLLRFSSGWLSHFPERPDQPEVDFVLTIGERRVPLEVKYRHSVDNRDLDGLRTFLETGANNASFGVVVTQQPFASTDPRIIAVTLPSLLAI